MKFFHLIWANLMRKKLRALLTFLSILMAFVLYGYLCAIREAFSAGVSVAGADRIVVMHKMSLVMLLPVNYKTQIERIEGVDAVASSTWFGGMYQGESKNFFPQIVVEPETYMKVYPEYLLSEKEKQAWLTTRTGAIVGRKTAKRFGFKVGDRVPIQATIWNKKGGGRTWEFDIVGIFDGKEKGTDTTGFLFRYDYFDEAREFGQGQVGWYVARVADPEKSEQTAKKIDALFANSPAEVKADTEKAFVQSWAKQIGDIGKIMVAILSAVFFTILLVAGNTMGQAVRERREELGVLKAIGFTNGGVLAIVLVESCLLSSLAGVLGLGLAWILIAQGDPTGGALAVFYFPSHDLALGFVFVLALGVAAGILPAIQAMRLNVADALRRM